MSPDDLAASLEAQPSGCGWMARCPAHDDRVASLSIAIGENGRVLVHCHAGCEQARVISALRARGLWPGRPSAWDQERASTTKPPPVAGIAPKDNRIGAALAIWGQTVPAAGTIVETYLSSRLLSLPPTSALRFHHGLRHQSRVRYPAMVALVSDIEGRATGIHRTFLRPDGCGKAPVKPAKMMLGRCRSGAVRLADPAGVLLVSEGIENALAGMQASGHAAWAALSAASLRALNLPDDVRDVVVLADGDDAGEGAALSAAHRWRREGRRARIARPPRGFDFNDLLLIRDALGQAA